MSQNTSPYFLLIIDCLDFLQSTYNIIIRTTKLLVISLYQMYPRIWRHNNEQMRKKLNKTKGYKTLQWGNIHSGLQREDSKPKKNVKYMLHLKQYSYFCLPVSLQYKHYEDIYTKHCELQWKHQVFLDLLRQDHRTLHDIKLEFGGLTSFAWGPQVTQKTDQSSTSDVVCIVSNLKLMHELAQGSANYSQEVKFSPQPISINIFSLEHSCFH